MADLFAHDQETGASADRPLPDRLRPRSLEEIVGQEHLVGAGAPIRALTPPRPRPRAPFPGSSVAAP